MVPRTNRILKTKTTNGEFRLVFLFFVCLIIIPNFYDRREKSNGERVGC